MKREPVKSSNIKSFGYDSASKKLEVEFTTGDVYSYDNVSPATILKFKRAKSKGHYFATAIKSKYKGVKL